MKRTSAVKMDVLKPKVYSYIRFSTPEQSQGDSLRRQIERARSYAEKVGMPFDEELKDEGLSGFSGANRKKGALGRFLEKVRRGIVPEGSVLFVEEIDRLSREGMTDALQTIVFGLINNGVVIQTPNETYDKKSLNERGGIWLLIAKLQNAHDESRKKSERLGSLWEHKRKRAREEKVIATKRCPRWLRFVDGRFEPIPEAVKVIRTIFKQLPSLGRSRLVRKLNESSPWKPHKKGWRISYVRTIATSRSVLGEYQPYIRKEGQRHLPAGEPIPDYYPRIIDDETFRAVKLHIEKSRGAHRGGPIGSALNVLQGLAKCGYCGGSMVYVDPGPLERSRSYLVCDSARRGLKCRIHSIHYLEVLDCVLDNCRRLEPGRVLPKDDQIEEKNISLRMKIANAEAEIQENEARSNNLVAQISDTKSQTIRTRYEVALEALETRNRGLHEQLLEDRSALLRSERRRASFLKWQRDVTTVREAISPKNAIDERLKLRAHLREFITKIEIFSDGFEIESSSRKDDATNSSRVDTFSETMDEIFATYGIQIAPKRRQAFKKFVMKRRMSREGRFIRIHFEGGSTFDVVPMGSLASGEALVNRAKNQWKFVTPDLGKLWEQFRNLRSR